MSNAGPTTVTLEFDHKLSEHLAADRLYRGTSAWRKVDKAVAILLASFGAWSVAAAGLRWWTVVWFPLAVGEWFDLLSIRPLQIRIALTRNPKFLETHRIEFSDAGIEFRTTTINSYISWQHYKKCLENQELILLIYGHNLYSVIPKRAFNNHAQYDQLKQLIRSHLPNSD